MHSAFGYYLKRRGLLYAIFRKGSSFFGYDKALVNGNRALTHFFYDYFRKMNADSLQEELTEQMAVFYSKLSDENLSCIDKPKTFTEKIQWLKVHGDIAKMTVLADKVKARNVVGEIIGDSHIIPLVGGPYKSIKEIEFSKLPDKYVLKANHGSGMNIVVANGSPDEAYIQRRARVWLNTLYGWKGCENQYFGIEPLLYAEQYIEGLDGNLFDYKVHCFDGHPKFIQVIGNRDLKKHAGRQKNYDFNWSDLGWVFEDYPAYETELKKPECLSEMYDIASKLSAGFPYVRVDMYEIDGMVYFGEMTFTPASGIYPYKGTWNKNINYLLGEWIPV